MRLAPLATLFILAAGCCAFAQNTISVTAQGQAESAPDTAIVAFDVSAQAKSARSAYDAARRQTEQIRQLLRRNAIVPSEVELGSYQVEPQMDWKTRAVTGYSVAVRLTAKLTDFAKIAPLLDAAGNAGLPVGQSVAFTLAHPEAAKSAAVAAGYRHARAEAAALAAAAGESLGGLLSASIDVPEPVRPIVPFARAMVAGMAAPAPAPTAGFTPREITVTASIRAEFALGR